MSAGFERLMRAGTHLRGCHDCWSHAMVARGALDALVELGLNRWDIAATEVIVEEAGGACRIRRSHYGPGKYDVVLGNVRAVDEVARIIGFDTDPADLSSAATGGRRGLGASVLAGRVGVGCATGGGVACATAADSFCVRPWSRRAASCFLRAARTGGLAHGCAFAPPAWRFFAAAAFGAPASRLHLVTGARSFHGQRASGAGFSSPPWQGVALAARCDDGLVRRACFQALRAMLARLRARRTSRLASLMRLRARLSSSLASLTLCLATSTRNRARATAAPSSALASGVLAIRRCRGLLHGAYLMYCRRIGVSRERCARQGIAYLIRQALAAIDLLRIDGYAFGESVIHRSCV